MAGKTMAYNAKTLSGVRARVRQLENLRDELSTLLEQYDRQRRLLAMLAAETPQFHNPLLVHEAKQIRDELLCLPGGLINGQTQSGGV